MNSPECNSGKKGECVYNAEGVEQDNAHLFCLTPIGVMENIQSFSPNCIRGYSCLILRI